MEGGRGGSQLLSQTNWGRNETLALKNAVKPLAACGSLCSKLFIAAPEGKEALVFLLRQSQLKLTLVRLLAKYLLINRVCCDETFRKLSMGGLLHPVNFWSKANSRWPPQLTELAKHKNG